MGSGEIPIELGDSWFSPNKALNSLAAERLAKLIKLRMPEY